MNTRHILTGLSSSEYEHPTDREALDALKAVHGLSSMVRKADEIGLDRVLHLQSLANKVRVTPLQFPHIYDLFSEAAKILDIDQQIDLYIEQDYSLNAYTAGVEYPHVTATTELITSMDDDELMFVFGHELGHIKSEHVLYQQIAMYVPMLVSVIGHSALGIGDVIWAGVQTALYDWIRKSELSADRAGLLVCQNPRAARNSMYKLAGVPGSLAASVNIEELERQAMDFQRLSQDTSNRFLQHIAQMWNKHPWIAIRVNELIMWEESNGYAEVLEKHDVSRGKCAMEQHVDDKCPKCKGPVYSGAAFCAYCGTRLTSANELAGAPNAEQG